jgi:hypothetical protein
MYYVELVGLLVIAKAKSKRNIHLDGTKIFFVPTLFLHALLVLPLL